jgi:hypothetical protein
VFPGPQLTGTSEEEEEEEEEEEVEAAVHKAARYTKLLH